MRAMRGPPSGKYKSVTARPMLGGLFDAWTGQITRLRAVVLWYCDMHIYYHPVIVYAQQNSLEREMHL